MNAELESKIEQLLQAQKFSVASKLLLKELNENGKSAQSQYLYAGLFGYQGKFDKAEEACLQALVLEPDHVMANFRLANALNSQAKFFEARQYFEKAIELEPSHPHFWNNFGTSLLAQKLFQEAYECFSKAIDIDKQEILFHTNVGLAFIGLEMYQEALDLAMKLSQMQASPGDVHYCQASLALAFRKANQPDMAEDLFSKVLRSDQTNADNYVNVGLAQLAQNKVDRAIENLILACESDSSNVEAHWSLAGAYLIKGDYRQGWPLYEWRWRRKSLPELIKSLSLWNGANAHSSENKNLLVLSEQGAGDTMQFFRFIDQVKLKGWQIHYQCPKNLQRLFKQTGIVDNFPSNQELKELDCSSYITIGSLAMTLKTDISSIPLANKYLQADLIWNQELVDVIASEQNIIKVGLVWKGNPRHANDANRSMQLETLKPLLKDNRLKIFSLQVGNVSQEEQEMLAKYNVIDLSENINDFADTSVAIDQLDLVVCVDTSVAHLCGALGKKAFVLLPFAPDWRWGLESDKSAWYESLTLIRQSHWNDWNSVITQLQRLL